MLIRFIFAITFVSSLLFAFIVLIDWITHVALTKGNCSKYGWGTRELFWFYFMKNELSRKNESSNSFFNTRNNSCFHEQVIKFNGIGMLLNPIDLCLVKLKMKADKRELNRKSIHVWKIDN